MLKARGRLHEGKAGKRMNDFTDVLQIDIWAKEAMEYFTKTGIIVGSGGKLYPKENTTRTEIAQVLRNILMQ